MSDNPREVANKFVDLVLRYTRWPEVSYLPAGEVEVLFNLVVAAGFNPKQVVLGRLVGNIFSLEGINTGLTCPINRFCPFKVVGQEGDDYMGTIWLDRWLRRVFEGMTEQNENAEKLTLMMFEEIERSYAQHACCA